MLINFTSKLKPWFTQVQSFVKVNNNLSTDAILKSSLSGVNKNYCNQYSSLYCFSTYFDQIDTKDVQSYSQKKYQNKRYRQLISLWKKPLQKKRKRQQRIKQIKQSLPEPPVQSQKLVAHNKTVGIQYPPKKNQIFCVVKVDGFQYKVTQDCVLILDTKQDHEINKTIKFQNVLLAGTPSYTILGRPFVQNTYVQGIIQSISDSQKTLVFKKKRRKQYKKSFGSRVKLTSCRISRIVHQITQQTLSKAVGLLQTKKQSQQQAQN